VRSVCADWKAANPKLNLREMQIRLPTEAEWARAAIASLPSPVSGEGPGMGVVDQPYPWSLPGNSLDTEEEVLHSANVSECGIYRTTPVDLFPLGQSTPGVWDLSGNVWEWQANDYSEEEAYPVLRGGSCNSGIQYARMLFRLRYDPLYRSWYYGFRVVVSHIVTVARNVVRLRLHGRGFDGLPESWPVPIPNRERTGRIPNSPAPWELGLSHLGQTATTPRAKALAQFMEAPAEL
jgi:hypothetical protein